jgi:hypothetical protein
MTVGCGFLGGHDHDRILPASGAIGRPVGKVSCVARNKESAGSRLPMIPEVWSG